MKSRSTDLLFMSSAVCASLALAAGVLAVFHVGERGISIALQLTGRLQFLLFWVAYSAGPLCVLFGSRFQPLARYSREFGLAFAAALLVHLGLVGLLCLIDKPPATDVFIFFGVAAASAYLLALFSIPRLQQALDSRLWWILSNISLNYIAYAFLSDFRNRPVSGGTEHIVEYLPFVTLALIGIALRIAAYGKRAHRWRQRSLVGQ
jgi:hypothetical protein